MRCFAEPGDILETSKKNYDGVWEDFGFRCWYDHLLKNLMQPVNLHNTSIKNPTPIQFKWLVSTCNSCIQVCKSPKHLEFITSTLHRIYTRFLTWEASIFVKTQKRTSTNDDHKVPKRRYQRQIRNRRKSKFLELVKLWKLPIIQQWQRSQILHVSRPMFYNRAYLNPKYKVVV